MGKIAIPKHAFSANLSLAMIKDNRPRHQGWKYFWALIIPLLGIVVQYFIQPYLKNRYPFISVFLGVTFVALMGGLGPALVSILVGYLGVTYFILHPGHFFYDLPHNISSVTTFFVSAFAVVISLEVMHRANRQIEKAKSESQRRQKELETLIQFSPVGIAIAEDSECSSIRYNAALRAIFQIPLGAELSSNIFIPHPSSPYRLYHQGKPIEDAQLSFPCSLFLGESFKNLELEVVFRNGQKTALLVSAEPLRDEQGNIKGSIAFFVDFTSIKESEDKLLAQEKKLRLVTDAMPGLISYIDPDFRYQFANKNYETWTGWKSEAIQGKPMKEILGQSAFELVRPYLERALQGEGVNYELDIEYKLAGPKHIRASYVPHFGAEGNVIGIFVLILDETKRKRSEDILNFFSEVNQAINESELEIKNIVDCLANLVVPRLADYYGVYYREFEDVRLLSFAYWDEGQKKVIRNLNRTLWEKKAGCENRCDDLPQQSEFLERKIFIPLKRRQVAVGLLSLAKEENKEFSSIDRELANHLASRLEIALEKAALYRDAKRYADELAKSNQELEQFAYIASHDLQEPIRIVTLYLEIIASKLGNAEKNVSEFIEYAREGALRAQTLIKELLEFARVGSRGKEFQETDFNKILDQAKAILKISIQESGAEITQDSLPALKADPSQMTQLFQNLLSNAIKYRNSEKPLKIHVSAKKDDGHWIFGIHDNGIGIDSKHHESIFVIFKRLHSREEYSGTGIGLAVCKKIVERHGGKIWVESILGDGANFYFSIPSHPAALNLPQPSFAQAQR